MAVRPVRTATAASGRWVRGAPFRRCAASPERSELNTQPTSTEVFYLSPHRQNFSSPGRIRAGCVLEPVHNLTLGPPGPPPPRPTPPESQARTVAAACAASEVSKVWSRPRCAASPERSELNTQPASTEVFYPSPHRQKSSTPARIDRIFLPLGRFVPVACSTPSTIWPWGHPGRLRRVQLPGRARRREPWPLRVLSSLRSGLRCGRCVC